MDLVYEMFCRNYWGWGHLLLSVLVTALIWRLFIANKRNIRAFTESYLKTYLWRWRLIGFAIVLVVVVGWEVWEYWYESARLGLTPDHIYGTMEHYKYDTIGDIVLGIIGYCIGVI